MSSLMKKAEVLFPKKTQGNTTTMKGDNSQNTKLKYVNLEQEQANNLINEYEDIIKLHKEALSDQVYNKEFDLNATSLSSKKSGTRPPICKEPINKDSKIRSKTPINNLKNNNLLQNSTSSKQLNLAMVIQKLNEENLILQKIIKQVTTERNEAQGKAMVIEQILEQSEVLEKDYKNELETKVQGLMKQVEAKDKQVLTISCGNDTDLSKQGKLNNSEIKEKNFVKNNQTNLQDSKLRNSTGFNAFGFSDNSKKKNNSTNENIDVESQKPNRTPTSLIEKKSIKRIVINDCKNELFLLNKEMESYMKDCRKSKEIIQKLQGEKQELLQVNFKVSRDSALQKERVKILEKVNRKTMVNQTQYETNVKNRKSSYDSPNNNHNDKSIMSEITPNTTIHNETTNHNKKNFYRNNQNKRSKSSNKLMDINSILDFHRKFQPDADSDIELSSPTRFDNKNSYLKHDEYGNNQNYNAEFNKNNVSKNSLDDSYSNENHKGAFTKSVLSKPPKLPNSISKNNKEQSPSSIQINATPNKQKIKFNLDLNKANQIQAYVANRNKEVNNDHTDFKAMYYEAEASTEKQKNDILEKDTRLEDLYILNRELICDERNFDAECKLFV